MHVCATFQVDCCHNQVCGQCIPSCNNTCGLLIVVELSEWMVIALMSERSQLYVVQKIILTIVQRSKWIVVEARSDS